MIPVKDLKRDVYFDKDIHIDNSLLILGSRAGLYIDYDQAYQFINLVVQACGYNNISVFYRPHPDEPIEAFSILESFKTVHITLKSSKLKFVPRFAISPFSSLGYDLPFHAKKYYPEHSIQIYHGFTEAFNNSYHSRFPDSVPMLYDGATNYLEDSLSEFIAAIYQ